MSMRLTSAEITERRVHLTLTAGRHRKHVERLSASLLEAQSRLNARLEKCGLTPFAAARGECFGGLGWTAPTSIPAPSRIKRWLTASGSHPVNSFSCPSRIDPGFVPMWRIRMFWEYLHFCSAVKNNALKRETPEFLRESASFPCAGQIGRASA